MAECAVTRHTAGRTPASPTSPNYCENSVASNGHCHVAPVGADDSPKRARCAEFAAPQTGASTSSHWPQCEGLPAGFVRFESSHISEGDSAHVPLTVSRFDARWLAEALRTTTGTSCCATQCSATSYAVDLHPCIRRLTVAPTGCTVRADLTRTNTQRVSMTVPWGER